jgi:hypothetical protein
VGYVEEPDGTRVYDHGKRYKPLALHERKYRKFPAGTIWHGGKPFGPLSLLPDSERLFPATRSDDEAAKHQLGCRCVSCSVPRVQKLKRKRIYAEIRSSSS